MEPIRSIVQIKGKLGKSKVISRMLGSRNWYTDILLPHLGMELTDPHCQRETGIPKMGTTHQ